MVVMMMMVVLGEIPNVTEHDQRGSDVIPGRPEGGRAFRRRLVRAIHQLS